MWQISYPLRMVGARVIIYWQKCDFSLKHLHLHLILKSGVFIKNVCLEATMGGCGFFLQVKFATSILDSLAGGLISIFGFIN